MAAERQEVINTYGLTMHPAFAFVDRNGKVIDRAIGPIPEAQLRERLATLLAAP